MRSFKIVFIVLIAITFVWGGIILLSPRRGQDDHQDHAQKELYYCPMHPQIVSDHPGTCPICNMKLVKRAAPQKDPQKADHSASDAMSGYASVQLNASQAQLIGIKTAEVLRRPLVKTVHAYGMVTHETELYQVQNEFIDAYIQYINTYRDYQRVIDRRRSWETHRDLQVKMLEAEHKLLMLGLRHEQIAILRRIERHKIWDQPELMFLHSENNFWISAQLFEDDLGYVDIAQNAQIELSAYRETFDGVVRSVGGAIDPEMRTVRILIEPKDRQQELTIGMLANVNIKAELGDQLSVPQEAVLDLGNRYVVFVSKAEGIFEPREVTIGAKADDYWAVTKGLVKGEKVVVDGNFLLDSESRLKASMDASAQGGEGHVH